MAPYRSGTKRRSLSSVRLLQQFAKLLLCAAATTASGALSCGAGRSLSDPSARYFSIHSALQASGLTQVGTINRGQLLDGQGVSLPLDLSTQCVTLVALAGVDSQDIELSVTGADGKQIAKDETRGPDASLRYCPDRPGKYAVQVRLHRGAGPYLVSAWSGGRAEPVLDGGSAGSAMQSGGGTCESPVMLSPGQTYTGDTEEGRSVEEGSCGNTGARELVYRLDMPTRQRVTIEVRAQFDSVLYVRKGECNDVDAEVACNDDASGGSRRSRIDEVFEPGTYYVFVDGYGEEEGGFRLTITTRGAGTSSESCSRAPVLASRATVHGEMASSFDSMRASCGRNAKGPDVAYRVDVASRSRVRFTEFAKAFSPAVHLHASCDADAQELGCSERAISPNQASFANLIDPGTYYVFADAANEVERGEFSLWSETQPEFGEGSPGDTCGDAVSISEQQGELVGDTFAARDDVFSSCSAEGSPEVVYRLDLTRRSRVFASVAQDEGRHHLALRKSCGSDRAEISCGAIVDQSLGPGLYFLVVDPATSNAFGRFRLRYRIEDMAATDAICAASPVLRPGSPVSSSTATSDNRFTPTCSASGDQKGSKDRVYKFSLSKTSQVTMSIEGAIFPAVLSLRGACANAASEISCAHGSSGAKVVLRRSLPAGTYYAIVDGRGDGSEGEFALRLDVQQSTGKQAPAKAKNKM